VNGEMVKSDHRPLILDTDGVMGDTVHSREGCEDLKSGG
jgi:hypothetical protein